MLALALLPIVINQLTPITVYCFNNTTCVFNTSSTVFSQNSLNEQFIAAK